jgi:hypothetical protein
MAPYRGLIKIEGKKKKNNEKKKIKNKKINKNRISYIINRRMVDHVNVHFQLYDAFCNSYNP